jgi:adenine-specific DNA-methyltransferase
MMLDTQHFDRDFIEKLISSDENIEQSHAGLLFNADNYQSIRLIEESMQREVSSIYIDPPYNTPHSEIIYKNNFKNSSWMTFIKDRLTSSTVRDKQFAFQVLHGMSA